MRERRGCRRSKKKAKRGWLAVIVLIQLAILTACVTPKSNTIARTVTPPIYPDIEFFYSKDGNVCMSREDADALYVYLVEVDTYITMIEAR